MNVNCQETVYSPLGKSTINTSTVASDSALVPHLLYQLPGEFTGLLIDFTFSESWARAMAFGLLKSWATFQTEHIIGVQLIWYQGIAFL
jgi:hypothetical protein